MDPKLLALLNQTLPGLLALYRSIRDANPDQPALTDAQIIELLRIDSAQVVSTAQAWLESHPPTDQSSRR